MKNLRQKLKSVIQILLLAVALFSTPLALAQTNFNPPTVLPSQNANIGGRGDACVGLADRIRNGDIQLRHIPCFIKFITQTVVGVAGSLSVIFVMVGGYWYVLGKDEQKDQAKKTITYALIGLAVSLLAWIIVDIALQLITE